MAKAQALAMVGVRERTEIVDVVKVGQRVTMSKSRDGIHGATMPARLLALVGTKTRTVSDAEEVVV